MDNKELIKEILSKVNVPRPNALTLNHQKNEAFIQGYQYARNELQKSKNRILKELWK